MPSLYPQISGLELLIDSTTTIEVSEIVHDEDAGDYVRVLSIYTSPIDDSNRTPALTVKLRGGTISAVQIATPTLEF